MNAHWTQAGAGVRMEWGPTGAKRLVDAGPSGCLVVLDVLSFTTAVSVAVEAGTVVYPYPWRDGTAVDYARRNDAALAVGRRQMTADTPWSLSPAALRRAPATDRLVLPSPNGSAIAAAADGDMPVVAASLRTFTAAARWLISEQFGTPERPVLVVPAGERWPDGSLRPALEDLLGAGAVISAFAAAGRTHLSPEAEAARLLFEATPDVPKAVRTCGSGLELEREGFGEDVDVAVEVDVSTVAAVRVAGAFTAIEPGGW